MTVCESDSGLCWDLDEETLARAILTFCLNTADALMTALLKGTADAWEALTLIRDSDPELRTSAGAGKVIEQAFCIGMTRWGSKPTPQAVRSFRSALATWQQRLRTLPTWDRDYLCGWFTMEGRQWVIAPHDVWWPTRLNDLALLGRCAPPLCLWGSGDRAALTSCPQPVGIVGSRGVNEYGRRLTTDIAVHAAQAGHLVVSGGAMGADAAADYTEVTLDRPFYGVYSGYAALPLAGETLRYLTNDTIAACRVTNFETGGEGPVYDLEKARGSAAKYTELT